MLAVAAALAGTASARAEIFEIPAQSLATAIDAFCAATGAEVYYDGAATLGFKSSRITGDHTRDGALRILLSGTDLVPLKVRTSAYLLINPGDDAARALAAAKLAQDARYRDYFAVVQQSVLQSLCRLSDRSMMPERMVIRLWIDPTGAVRQLQADDLRDGDSRISNFHMSLRDLRLPEAPPRNMPQPVTVALLPGKSVAASYCPPMAVPLGH